MFLAYFLFGCPRFILAFLLIEHTITIPMLRINYVTISGFKSYASEHHIGPFSPRVTLLVGCNGSGKSSLLEAISFVLGSDSVTLRSNNLRNLIARAKSDDTPCSVALHCSVIKNSDGDSVETSNLDVTRTIDKRGTSKYYLRLNSEAEKPIKFDEIHNIMREYGVDMSLSER
jgi:chromosome segregation ATPase